MSNRDFLNKPQISQYLQNIVTECDAQKGLREVTQPMTDGGMQITAVSGRLIQQIIGMVGGKKAIEVGVFTGYSVMCTAKALGEGGKVIACDVSDEWTSIGKPYWEKAGIADRIDLRIAPADQTMQSLIDQGQAGTFDYIFIDADKTGYDTYYELGLTLLRQGGVILVDNTLWGGRVPDDSVNDADTVALRNLNEKMFSDDRVFASFLPFDDGMVLVRKL